MASPGQNLRTHNSNLTILSQLNQLVDPVRELFRLHIVSESSEGRVPPIRVHGIRLGMTQTTQLPHKNVFDCGLFQALGQRFPVELWVVPRARDCSDIDESDDGVSA